MRALIILISVLGFVTLVNAQDHNRSRGQGHGAQQHFGQGSSLRMTAPGMVRTAPPVMQSAPGVVQTAPPVMQTTPRVVQTAPPVMQTTPGVVRTAPPLMQTAPRINAAPRRIDSAPVTVTQPVPRFDTRQEKVSRVRHQGFQSNNWHRDRDTEHRHGHKRHHGNYQNHYYGGTSVFVPYWWYGAYPYNDDYYSSSQAPYYSSSTYAAYPHRIFICYVQDQVYDDRYHIDCPAPISWYNTDPAYASEDYQSQYHPDYVCSDHGATHYVEFSNSYDANTWWNNNCNRWVYTP